MKRSLAMAIAWALASFSLLAGAEASDTAHPPETAAHEHEEHEEHEGHRHHVSLFLGGATTSEEHRNDRHGFVGGLDYEYRFSRWVGVGAVAEGAAGNLRDAVFVGSLFIHPWRGVVLGVGPGVEVTSAGSEYVTRFAIAYQIPLWRRLTIAPDFSVDLVKKEPIFVYGVALGVGF